MKGKLVNKLLENRKLVRTGCGLMAAVVLLSGGLYVYDTQNTYMPELVEIIDGGDAVISDEEVPLAKPTVKKTTKTKKTTKNVKLKTASKKTYSKTLPTKKTKKTTTKTTTKGNTKTTVQTVVETTTSQVEKYTKKKKVKKVVTTVKTVTTVTTTTTTVATKKSATTAAKTLGTVAKTSSGTVKKELNVMTALPKADAKLRSAYLDLGFIIKVDSTVSYSGRFDARSRTITMRKENDDAIYHEFGHFLAFMGGISASDSERVYAAEKAQYTGVNKAYVNQNADEYIAESYRDYCTNKTALKQSRPQTYALIEDALSKVTDAQIAKYKKVYAAYWK